MFETNKGIASIDNDVKANVKIHRWPFIKSHDDKSGILTIEFESIREANRAKQSSNIKIEMFKDNGEIYKVFTSAWLKTEDLNNSPIVVFTTDFWEEKNLLN